MRSVAPFCIACATSHSVGMMIFTVCIIFASLHICRSCILLCSCERDFVLGNTPRYQPYLAITPKVRISEKWGESLRPYISFRLSYTGNFTTAIPSTTSPHLNLLPHLPLSLSPFVTLHNSTWSLAIVIPLLFYTLSPCITPLVIHTHSHTSLLIRLVHSPLTTFTPTTVTVRLYIPIYRHLPVTFTHHLPPINTLLHSALYTTTCRTNTISPI